MFLFTMKRRLVSNVVGYVDFYGYALQQKEKREEMSWKVNQAKKDMWTYS